METLRANYDPANGGFGSAPKFPPASALEFLLRRGETDMTAHTLRAMASGGMYDQVGGGFARYSVDPYWLVPHFEKMLYDNALLARAYLHGWQVTGDPLFRAVTEETLDWALREMRGSEGGFYSALDADSEGEEGKFYVWTLEELREALAGEPDADEAIAWFGATDRGNFEGKNIPVRGPGEPDRRDTWRERLYDVRAKRVWPGLDDKRLTSWNALMIAALADAGAVLERDDYLDAARGTAEFVLGDLRDPGGRLLRTWKDGQAKLNAYLEDHAFLLEALISLYEATFEPRWFGEARALADIDDRAVRRRGERRLLRDLVGPRAARGPPEGPGGPSDPRRQLERRLRPAAARGAHRRARVRGAGRVGAPASPRDRAEARAGVRPPAPGTRLPAGAGEGGGARGRGAPPLERVVRDEFRPHLVLAGGEADGVPLLEGRDPVDGRATAYVCEQFACRAPVTEPAELEALLS